MPEKSLGLITIGANPVQATVNNADPTLRVFANTYQIQHFSNNNVGRIYVGNSDLDANSGAGLLNVLPAPADNPYLTPLLGLPVEEQELCHDMSTLYIDGDNPGDQVLVKYIEP